MASKIINGNRSVFVLVLFLLFVFNVLGYTSFRYFVTNDVYGGDSNNLYLFRGDSLELKKSFFYKDISFLAAKFIERKDLAFKNDPALFIFSHLSEEGRGAAKRLARDTLAKAPPRGRRA